MALSLLVLAAMADPAAIAPSSKWQVEYAAHSCVLSRDYGAGPDTVSLGLSPLPMSENSEVALLTRGKNAVAEKGEVAITMLPGGKPATSAYRRYPLPKGGGHLATMFFSGDALAGLDKASAVEVRLGTESYTLAVPGVAGGLAALSTCQDDLLKGWGIDPAERKLVATHVQGNVGRFFGPTAYPLQAVREHLQGRTVTVATIDAEGAVTACRVVVSSGASPGYNTLDKATCDIVLRKVRFTPARDKDGNAVASHYVIAVRWVLPGS